MTREGLLYEADRKHAKVIIENVGISASKVVTTPGIEVKAVEAGEGTQQPARAAERQGQKP